MASFEDLEKRFAIRDVGERVYERFLAGEPLIEEFCGLPAMLVFAIRPIEYDLIESDYPNRSRLYIENDRYPLAAIVPLKHPTREPGAAMILKTPKLGLMGVRIVSHHRLNEIGAIVGGFSGFESI